MRIAIGSDHVGVSMKLEMIEHLKARGLEVEDFGTDRTDASDYPIYGQRVAKAVAGGQCTLGVLICGTGIGISLAAGKVPGIRAAVVSEPFSATMARAHNDANIIAFGARVVGIGTAKSIVDAFLDASFEGGRHKTRVDMITAIGDGKDL